MVEVPGRRRRRRREQPEPEVIVMTRLTSSDPAQAQARFEQLRAAGATELVHASRYADAEEFQRQIDWIVEHLF